MRKEEEEEEEEATDESVFLCSGAVLIRTGKTRHGGARCIVCFGVEKKKKQKKKF